MGLGILPRVANGLLGMEGSQVHGGVSGSGHDLVLALCRWLPAGACAAGSCSEDLLELACKRVGRCCNGLVEVHSAAGNIGIGVWVELTVSGRLPGASSQ